MRCRGGKGQGLLGSFNVIDAEIARREALHGPRERSAFDQTILHLEVLVVVQGEARDDGVDVLRLERGGNGGRVRIVDY